jgi:hypothetical protein
MVAEVTGRTRRVIRKRDRLLFAMAIGLIWTGTVPLTSGLVGDIFGSRHMGLLFGIVYVGHQLGELSEPGRAVSHSIIPVAMSSCGSQRS